MGTNGSDDDRQVSVIVPTYNRVRLLTDLLESLNRQTLSHEVIVVDNGSTDGTAELAHRHVDVEFVSFPENVGFARAVNRGAAAASGDVLVFLNNDVVCEPEFLANISSVLDRDGPVAMAAAVLVQARDTRLIDTAGIEFDPTLLAFDYLHGEDRSVLEGPVRDPLGPCAGAAAFSRTAFEDVGGFDERIFAYLEDVDLVIRLLARGARCRLATGAIAVHRHSATLGPRSRAKNELIGWSRGYLIGKYRLHRRPGLFARTLVEELTGAVGKLAVDHAGLALGARIRGWRAGVGGESFDLPQLPSRVREISFVDAQRRRISRRARTSKRN